MNSIRLSKGQVRSAHSAKRNGAAGLTVYADWWAEVASPRTFAQIANLGSGRITVEINQVNNPPGIDYGLRLQSSIRCLDRLNAALLIACQEHGRTGRRDEKGAPGDFSPHKSSPYSWHRPLRACLEPEPDKYISTGRMVTVIGLDRGWQGI